MKNKFKGAAAGVLAAIMVISSSVVFCGNTYAVGSETVSAATVPSVTEADEKIVKTSQDSPSEPAEIVTQPATKATEPSTSPATLPSAIPTPTLDKVKNIEKTSFLTDQISLKWDPVSGATGYYIYYKNADSSDTFEKLAEVKSNSCTISKLSHTTQYHFKISAYVTINGQNYEGEGTVKKTATQPGKVSSLNKKRSSSVIEFTWGRNSKATGYRIYRACAKTDGKYVLYKTIRDNKTTTFTDKNIELGRAYYYNVKPFRELYGGEYNAPSAEIKFVCGLGAPDYSMTSQVSRVSLSWNSNKYASGYDIYYSTSSNGSFKKLDTTGKNFFNTVRLTNNKKYYFRVQPFKYVGSNKTKVTGTYATKYKTVTKDAYGVSVGGTYIEISLKQQHMWYYRDSKLYVETDVVTGNNDGYHNTPKGAFKIWQRSSPATLYGPGYASYVNYWMAFTYGGVGIHDSSWRSSYGGNIYKGNGSHGCVNTPYSKVKKIYQKAGIGTRVVVY